MRPQLGYFSWKLHCALKIDLLVLIPAGQVDENMPYFALQHSVNLDQILVCFRVCLGKWSDFNYKYKFGSQSASFEITS